MESSIFGHRRRQIIILLLLILAIIALKNAWLSDDAYISFRTAENAINGHGLVYNIGERVQCYTHPLWLLLLIAFRWLSGEFYYTALLLGVLLSLTAVALVLRIPSNLRAMLLTFCLLIASKAFCDYTTSGLENPLSYLFIAAFVAIALDDKKGWIRIAHLSLLCSATALTRLDNLVILIPVMIAAVAQERSKSALWAAALGLSPLALWTTFSLLYYGAPVANTAYAKLGAGVSAAVLAQRGYYYLVDSISRDPITIVAIATGLIAAFVSRKRNSVLLAFGIVLHLIYVVAAGGDFMSGRFLTVPLLVSACLLARYSETWGRVRMLIAAALIVLLSVPSAKTHLFSGQGFGDVPLTDAGEFGSLPLSLIDEHGVCDERAFYYQATGLLRPVGGAFPSHQWATTGLVERSKGPHVLKGYAIGMIGFYAGPDVHIVDENALCDFLLARLPIPRGSQWSIGHFTRRIPVGYVESIESGENRVTDSDLARFYDVSRLIIREPLFAPGRLAAIWRLNTGGYQQLVDAYVARSPESF